MSSPLEKLVLEVIKIPLGLKFALCVSTSIVLFSSSVVGFIVVALYNTSTACHNCCGKEDFKAVQQTLGKKSFLEDSLISSGK